MHTSQSSYICICSQLVLTWFYFRHKFTATLRWLLLLLLLLLLLSPLLFFPPSVPSFLDISTLCGTSVTKPTSIFVFPKLLLLQFFPCPSLLPSFCMTHFLTSCFHLISFFLIDIFILVLCSKPLELYLHSFLKHADIILLSYFLSQKINSTCTI